MGVYMALLLTAMPYLRRIDDRLCATSQVYLLLILLCGLVLQQNQFRADSVEDIAGSIILLVVVAALALLLLYHLFVFVRKVCHAMHSLAHSHLALCRRLCAAELI